MRILMWNVSSAWADFLFDVSNWILIGGAFAVFIGTIGSITMGTAKEYFANERLSANETATERAKADAERAKADAEIAKERPTRLNAPLKPTLGLPKPDLNWQSFGLRARLPGNKESESLPAF
jgi:hypothetical protein